MSLFTAFKTAKNKEIDGFWFEGTGVVNADKTVPGFLLARASRSNPKFAGATERIAKQYARQFANGTMVGDQAILLERALFSDTLLLDWRNVQPKDDGVNLEYNAANVEWLLTELPDLYDMLNGETKIAANYRDEEVEKLSGN